MNGTADLMNKRGPKSSQSLPPCGNTVGRQLSMNQEVDSQTMNPHRLCQRPDHGTSQPPGLWEILVCCLSHMVFLF